MALGLTPEQIIQKNTHPLLRISKTWNRVLLEDIAAVQNGYAFSSKHFNHEKGLPLIRIRDISKYVTENLYNGEYQDEFIVRSGDILIGMDGDFNADKWKGDDGLLNQRVCRLFPKSKHFSVEFLFLCLQPYLNAINEETSSVTVKHLSSATIRRIPLPLPPLPEQRAIVAKLESLFSELDNGIANLKKAQEQLKVYRQAVLKKAFEGELTKSWREKQTDLPTAEELLEQIKTEREEHFQKQLDNWKQVFKEWEAKGKEGKKPGKPKKLKEYPALEANEKAKLPKLPTHWLLVSLGNLFLDSPQNGLYKPAELYGEGTDIIRIDDFYAGRLIRKTGFKKVKLLKDEVKKYLIENGQVLINRVNSIEYLGKCGLVEMIGSPTVFESNIMKLQLVENYISPKYIVHCLTSLIGIREIRKNAKHAVNQASINQTDVSLTSIPLLSFDEQLKVIEEIESRLSVCDKVETTIEENLTKAEALRQSILKKAFEGKLLNEQELETCRKETDWEPAEKLLERIRAEKATAEKTAKQKKTGRKPKTKGKSK